MGDREVDQQLVERAQRGDKQAFGLLVQKYQRKLGRLLSRFIRDPAEVEDVAQEAFVKAYRALPAFRGDPAFDPWLDRIGSNPASTHPGARGGGGGGGRWWEPGRGRGGEARKTGVCELVDGEPEASAAGELIAQACRPGEAADTWCVYHLIGDALRGARPMPADFAERIAS